jgi:predicted GIY-YIG superfamily endonuclease
MKYLDGLPYEIRQIGRYTLLLVQPMDLFYRSEDTYVYLVHLYEPIRRSTGVEVRHYCGSTTQPAVRFWQHEHSTTGAALLKEARRRGILWTIPIVWQATRDFEQKLKRERHLDRHCPICQFMKSNTDGFRTLALEGVPF